MSIAASSRVPELDGLRGIAILCVIGCHYEVFARQLWGLPKFGWVGVDLFFVLSGTLITTVLFKLKNDDRAFRLFYHRRFRRILPPYLGFMALVYAVSFAFADPTLFTFHTLTKNVFFLQAFGGLSTTLRHFGTWPLHHSVIPPIQRGLLGSVSASTSVLWSLSIEEYFYLLWAPAVLCMSRKALTVFACAICVGSLALRWLGFIGVASYFSVYHRFDALIFGALVSLLLSSAAYRKPRILALAGALGVVTLAAVLIPMGHILGLEIRADHVFAVFGIPALSLTAASIIGLSIYHSGTPWLAPLRVGLLRFFGTISYTLYLLHGLVYLCFLHFFEPTWIVSLCALALSICLSWLSWKFVERPILYGNTEKKAIQAHATA